MCAPTLLEFGTEEQRLRHVPKMLRGDEVWCSSPEPGAGSDVAGLQDRAVRHGDDSVINGRVNQGGHYFGLRPADRPHDIDVPKHRGISMFVVDMRSPGVDTCVPCGR